MIFKTKMMKKRYVFQLFLLFGGVENIKSSGFVYNFRLVLHLYWHLGSQEASRQPQDCFKLAYLSQSGPNFFPSWLQVASSWAHGGPICGSPATLGQPKPFQTPSQALPDPFLYIEHASVDTCAAHSVS